MIQKNYKSYIAYILLFGLAVIWKINSVSADSVIIENNVSATANTGGNVVEGGEGIQTGSASASSSSSTSVNSEGKTEINIKAEAAANGKTETKEIHKKIEGKASENVRVEASSESDEDEAEIKTEEEVREEINSLEDSQNANKENKNFFISVAEKISSAIRGVFDNIISLFK